MKPVSPVIPGRESEEIIIAENQDEYENLPALKSEKVKGAILTRWELNEQEIGFVRRNGYIYLWIWNFDGPVQPVLLEAGEYDV